MASRRFATVDGLEWGRYAAVLGALAELSGS